MTSIYRRIVLFFGCAILTGAALLSMPFALSDGMRQHSSFGSMILRGLFTATSAVCVTGLSIVDIGSYYNYFGQFVILALVQLGALGYVLFATASGLLAGRIPIKERLAIKEVMDPSSYEGLLSLLKHIIKIVMAIEILGAVILTLLFSRYFSFAHAAYYGIFHAVSAFANAGFSLFPTNLERFSGDIYLVASVGCLIVLGGIGFLVISEIIPRRQYVEKEDESALKRGKEKFRIMLPPPRFTLHTRMVLALTAVLILGGALVILFFENNNPATFAATAGGAHDFAHKMSNALFMSVTSRTAGFNTIKISSLMPVTIFILMVLMFIGASPGGTGGGVKTTTIGVAFLWVLSFLRGKNDINLAGRRIPYEIGRKAVGYILLGALYCLAAMSAVLFFEKNNINPLWCCFEVVSAFGTVGLSAGITPSLSVMSKIVIMVTMLVGRVGLLTLALSALRLGANGSGGKELIQYPEERVLVG